MTSSDLKNEQEHALKAIGLRIRALRAERNISVFSLGNLLRRNHNEIDKFESGNGQLTLQEMLVLASKFKVDFKWLCQELLDDKAACRHLSAREIESQIATELSKLMPGTLDRVLRLISPMRAERRAMGLRQSQSLLVLKRTQDLVDTSKIEDVHEHAIGEE